MGLGLGATALAWGCAQPADEWLAGVEVPPVVAADARVADATPPVVIRALRVGAVALPEVLEPRGLALGAAGQAWTTDRADDSLVAFDPASGTVLERWPLPAVGSATLALSEDGLLVGFAEQIWRFDGAGFTPLEASVSGLAGLAAEPGGVVSAEPGTLRRREGALLTPRLALRLQEAPGPLVRLGSVYLMAAPSARPDGVGFEARLWVLDATSPTEAGALERLAAPVAVSRITGLAEREGALFVIGGGYGEDVGRVVEFAVEVP